MHAKAHRKNAFYKKKKGHLKNTDRRVEQHVLKAPPRFAHMLFAKDPPMQKWSQTLKLYFLKGEDDLVTEEEVREYFTTEDYTPKTVIVGYFLKSAGMKVSLVHFESREEAQQARKEKPSGGPLGKASEFKAAFIDEKVWIRIRDGQTITGAPRRAAWMRAYGEGRYEGHGAGGLDNWFSDTGTRSNPYYPEEEAD